MIPGPIAVLGPTAVGKSAVADALAARLGGEIVNADSMQVYRRMDIGTAKTPPDERSMPYHCLDLVEPGEAYSAALYQRDARAAIDRLLGRDAVPVVVGGTGLYVRAALDELDFPAGELGGQRRRELEARAEREGSDALYRELQTADPVAAARIHPNNTRRVIRALEMLAEGRPYGEQVAGFSQRRAHYPRALLIGLTMDREQLYARIEERVDAMLQRGLLEETRALLESGYRDALTASQAIGYKELVPVLEGHAELAEAVGTIKQATRRYAKRQLTWFRADPRIRWIDVTGLSPAEASEAAFVLVESSEHHG